MPRSIGRQARASVFRWEIVQRRSWRRRTSPACRADRAFPAECPRATCAHRRSSALRRHRAPPCVPAASSWHSHRATYSNYCPSQQPSPPPQMLPACRKRTAPAAIPDASPGPGINWPMPARKQKSPKIVPVSYKGGESRSSLLAVAGGLHAGLLSGGALSHSRTDREGDATHVAR